MPTFPASESEDESEIREMVLSLPAVREPLSDASQEYGLHNGEPTFVPGHFRKVPAPPMPCADGNLAESTLHTHPSLLNRAACGGAG